MPLKVLLSSILIAIQLILFAPASIAQDKPTILMNGSQMAPLMIDSKTRPGVFSEIALTAAKLAGINLVPKFYPWPRAMKNMEQDSAQLIVGISRTMFGPGKDINAMNERMSGLMEAEGLPYGARSHTYNSRLAQELGSWADTQDGGDALHMKIYQAYFVDNKNVGDVDVLVELAESAGLDGSAARKVLEERSFEGAVDADWEKARQVGVTGVPTYVAAGAGVVGAQPYEALEQLMEHAGAEKKS